mgnify:CR=1 FL=1
MPKQQKLTKNPSFTEACQAQLGTMEKEKPVKKNAVKPLASSLSLTSNTSDTAASSPSKKSSQTDTNSRGSLSHSSRKGSRSSIRVSTGATVTPIDSDSEMIAKTRNQLEKEGALSPRPSSTSSTLESGKASARSILKKSRYANNADKLPPINPRRDSAGIAIKKGGKGHKIHFRGKLEDVNIVENWKIYNGHEYNTQSCNCNIF